MVTGKTQRTIFAKYEIINAKGVQEVLARSEMLVNQAILSSPVLILLLVTTPALMVGILIL